MTEPGTLPVRAAVTIGPFPALALALGAGRREAAGGFLAEFASLALVLSFALANRPLFTFVREAEVRRRPATLDALGNLTARVLMPSALALSRWIVRDASFDEATLAPQREALDGYTNLLFGVSSVRTAAALPAEGARKIADAIDAPYDPVRAAGGSVRVLWTPFRPGALPSRRVGEFVCLTRALPAASFLRPDRAPFGVFLAVDAVRRLLLGRGVLGPLPIAVAATVSAKGTPSPSQFVRS